ncbi:MAG: 16S rRNA processing protein RimM [Clostridiaceae bacterium]|jgi:16S rRNA processing protein RimM|nr:16S rRNA processing protein RimM [Clostridiaceae bacterium]
MSATQRQHLIVGRITAAHGIGGAVRVQSLTDDPDRFAALRTCWLLDEKEQPERSLHILSARTQKANLVLLQFDGVSDRDAALALRGRLLAVDRADAVKLPADHWFICDLLGCEVFDAAAGPIGTVHEVLQHTAQDVFVVRQPGQPDLLFPAIKTILRQVDLAARRIDVCLPDGLHALYRKEKA